MFSGFSNRADCELIADCVCLCGKSYWAHVLFYHNHETTLTWNEYVFIFATSKRNIFVVTVLGFVTTVWDQIFDVDFIFYDMLIYPGQHCKRNGLTGRI